MSIAGGLTLVILCLPALPMVLAVRASMPNFDLDWVASKCREPLGMLLRRDHDTAHLPVGLLQRRRSGDRNLRLPAAAQHQAKALPLDQDGRRCPHLRTTRAGQTRCNQRKQVATVRFRSLGRVAPGACDGGMPMCVVEVRASDQAALHLDKQCSNPVPATKFLSSINALRPASPRGFCMSAFQVNNRSTKTPKPQRIQLDSNPTGRRPRQNRRRPRSIGTEADLQLGKLFGRDLVPNFIQQRQKIVLSWLSECQAVERDRPVQPG